LNQLQNGFMSQIWFSPNFALNDPSNTTGNFTWLNYVCEQYLPITNYTNSTSNNKALNSGPADLNTPSDSFYDTYANSKYLDIYDIYENS